MEKYNWTNRNSYGCEHVGPMPEWTQSINDWLSYQHAIGRSAETLRTRWYQISRFSRITNKPIDRVTGDDVISYFLRNDDMRLDAKRGVRSCVKSFYDWAIEHGIASGNPIDTVPVIPMSSPAGLICPESAINEALKSSDEDQVLTVMLGAWLGLRRIEMTTINTERDILDNPDEMRIMIHGKGKKERSLPVPAELARKIRSRPAGWLFPGKIDGHAGVDYVAKRVQWATGYPSHSLRRRFATMTYYRTGCNIILVSKMLGHSNIATTMHYIGLDNGQMRLAVEAATYTDSYIRMQASSPLAFGQQLAPYGMGGMIGIGNPTNMRIG